MVRVAQPHDELGKAIQTELDVVRIPDARLGIVGRVITTKEPAIVQDTTREPDFNRTVDCAPGYVLTSCLCAPVHGAGGRVLAAVLLCNKQPPTSSGGGPAAPSAGATPAADEKPQQAEFTALDVSAAVMLTSLLAPPLERQLMRDGFAG